MTARVNWCAVSMEVFNEFEGDPHTTTFSFEPTEADAELMAMLWAKWRAVVTAKIAAESPASPFIT